MAPPAEWKQGHDQWSVATDGHKARRRGPVGTGPHARRRPGSRGDRRSDRLPQVKSGIAVQAPLRTEAGVTTVQILALGLFGQASGSPSSQMASDPGRKQYGTTSVYGASLGDRTMTLNVWVAPLDRYQVIRYGRAPSSPVPRPGSLGLPSYGGCSTGLENRYARVRSPEMAPRERGVVVRRRPGVPPPDLHRLPRPSRCGRTPCRPTIDFPLHPRYPP